MTGPKGRTILRAIGRVSIVAAGLALAMIIATSAVFAQSQKMEAHEAFSAVHNGDLILLDIRSPEEWAQTGVADGALPVTMHDPNFGSNLKEIRAKNPEMPIALICATGGRSNYVADVLEKNGFASVFDISEGMFGNGHAPGWIKRELPIVDVETARANYSEIMFDQNE